MLLPLPPHLVPPSQDVLEERTRKPQSVSTSMVISWMPEEVSYRPTRPAEPIQSHLLAEALGLWAAAVLSVTVIVFLFQSSLK